MCRPFLGKCVLINDKSNKRATTGHDAVWFDRNCIECKSVYVEAITQYNRTQSQDSKLNMYEKKRVYKHVVRKAKRRYFAEKRRAMSELRRKDPRAFWKHLKREIEKVQHSRI
jgi:hypothetical protein